MLDILDVAPTHEPDGSSLHAYLAGRTPLSWRDAALWEFDYRQLIKNAPEHFPAAAGNGSTALLSRIGPEWQYVHFPVLPSLLLRPETSAARPENMAARHPGAVIENLDSLLSTRMRHNDETLARALVWDYHSGTRTSG